MKVRVAAFWLQKHPTAAQRGWDFRWCPADVPANVRERISSMQTRHRLPAGASACLLAPELVVWARAFGAFVPSEQRRYVGLAGVTAEPVTPTDPARWAEAWPSVLAALSAPPAQPYADEPVDVRVIELRPVAMAAVPEDLLPAEWERRRELAGVVSGGGAAGLAEPHGDHVPSLVGRILAWLPAPDGASERVITLLPGDRAGPTPESVNLGHYLARAIAPESRWATTEPAYPAGAWRLAVELARAERLELGLLFGELGRLVDAWAGAPALRRYLLCSGALREAEVTRCDARAPAPLFHDRVPDAGWQWNRIVHYWGRGFLDEPDVVERLATVLARRIVADHLSRLDRPEAVEAPWRQLRRLALEALLTHDARARMMGALATRLPCLRGLA